MKVKKLLVETEKFSFLIAGIYLFTMDIQSELVNCCGQNLCMLVKMPA